MPQMTICQRYACWISKATHAQAHTHAYTCTHTHMHAHTYTQKYVILFLQQHRFHECTLMLCYTYIASLDNSHNRGQYFTHAQRNSGSQMFICTCKYMRNIVPFERPPSTARRNIPCHMEILFYCFEALQSVFSNLLLNASTEKWCLHYTLRHLLHFH